MSNFEEDEFTDALNKQTDENETTDHQEISPEIQTNTGELSDLETLQNVAYNPNDTSAADDSPSESAFSGSSSEEEEAATNEQPVFGAEIYYGERLPRVVGFDDDICEAKAGKFVSPFEPSHGFPPAARGTRRRYDHKINPRSFSPIPPFRTPLRRTKSVDDLHSPETSPTRPIQAGFLDPADFPGITFESCDTDDPLASPARWDDEDEDEEFRASIDRGEIQQQVADLPPPSPTSGISRQNGTGDDGFVPLEEATQRKAFLDEEMALRLLERREALKERNAHHPTVAAIKGPEPPRLKIHYLEKTLRKVKSDCDIIEERRRQDRAEAEKTLQALEEKTREARVLARKTELWRKHADDNREMAEMGRSMLESMSERERRDLDNRNKYVKLSNLLSSVQPLSRFNANYCRSVFTSNSPGFEWPINVRTQLAQRLTTFLHRERNTIERTDEETNVLTRQILDAGPLRFQALVDRLEAMSHPLRPDHLAQDLERFSHENDIEADGEIMFHARQLNDRSESPVPGLLQEISALELRRPQVELEQAILQGNLQETQHTLEDTRESEARLRTELKKVQNEKDEIEDELTLVNAKLQSIEDEKKRADKVVSDASEKTAGENSPPENASPDGTSPENTSSATGDSKTGGSETQKELEDLQKKLDDKQKEVDALNQKLDDCHKHGESLQEQMNALECKLVNAMAEAQLHELDDPNDPDFPLSSDEDEDEVAVQLKECQKELEEAKKAASKAEDDARRAEEAALKKKEEAEVREAELQEEIERLLREAREVEPQVRPMPRSRTTSPANASSRERSRSAVRSRSGSPATRFPSDRLPIGELRPSIVLHHGTPAATEGEEENATIRRRERRIRRSDAYDANVKERSQRRNMGMTDRNDQWRSLEIVYRDVFGWPYLPMISEDSRKLAFRDLAKVRAC